MVVVRYRLSRLPDDKPHELGILRDEVRHTIFAQPVSLLVEFRLDLPLSPSLGANLFPQLGSRCWVVPVSALGLFYLSSKVAGLCATSLTTDDQGV